MSRINIKEPTIESVSSEKIKYKISVKISFEQIKKMINKIKNYVWK